jgi:alpha-mannosidase
MFYNDREEALYFQRVKNLHTRLGPRLLPESIPLLAEHFVTDEPVPFESRLEHAYAPIQEGESWGTSWQCAWFKLTGTVPAEWAGKEVIADLDVGGEGLVFLPDGKVLQGITDGSLFFGMGSSRPWVRLFDAAEGGEEVELWLDGACNEIFGITPESWHGCHYTDEHLGEPEALGHKDSSVVRIRLAIFDRQLWELHRDLSVLISLYDSLPKESVRRAKILKAMTDCTACVARDENDFEGARKLLNDVMASPANASAIPVRAVGHAHIDTAWLWPLRESIRKCGRTFSTQLRLIEQYPGYVFGASAAQHYQYTKDYYPELYERIKKAVADGSWEVQGGMWVESDTNIPSGESLVRQFLHGKNFFRDEFGLDINNLWIPDVFGYSAALPQIMIQAGVDTFLTQKLSWCQFNTFPHNTFMWEGIDGSQILTHFPPENTYNSHLTPDSLNAAQGRFVEKAFINEIMSLFGIGDGGGGPRDEMIENGIRQKNLEGAPPVTFGKASDFFDELQTHKNELKTWVGELYFELHRGTLTSQARVKRCNRLLEKRLRELEMLWASHRLDHYPLAEFDAIWKTVLLHQFHDIIPGSSINRVYKETHENYDAALSECDALVERYCAEALRPSDDTLTLFNSLSMTYVGVVTLPEGWEAATEVPTQKEPGGASAYVEIPALSHLELTRSQAAGAESTSDGDLVLENERIRYEFESDGTLSRIFDKEAGREVIVTGAGNVLSLYHDRPASWDAWDVDRFYRDEFIQHPEIDRIEKTVSGPVRNGIRIESRVGCSKLTQDVFLVAGSKRLDFETEVDWKERHRILRVGFDVDVRSEQATYDIQFGYLQRPTHVNTSWDMARFEVPAHHYADLSDHDYGVALLNDCKYAYDVDGSKIELTLLRAPTWPDPEADQGIHCFTYSLLPHTGNHAESDVQIHAQHLNSAPVCFEGFAWGDAQVPLRMDSDTVRVEALKKAEKEDLHVIRLVERGGRHGKATLTPQGGAGELIETNVLEWTEAEAIPFSGPVELDFKPFQIRTFKLKRNA